MNRFLVFVALMIPNLCFASSLHELDYDTVELSVVQDLVEKDKLPVDEKDAVNHTPLMKAMASDRKQIADYLLKKGADINGQDDHGNAVLLATEKLIPGTTEYVLLPTDYIDKIKYLIDHQANINTQNNMGDVVLTIGNKDATTYQYLIDHGASINRGGRNGISPLMHTIFLNNFDAFMVILKQADKGNPALTITHKDDSKDMALHYVGRYCSDIKFEKELINRNANPADKSSKGMTFLGELLMAECPVSLFQNSVSLLKEAGYKFSKEDKKDKKFVNEAMTLHEAILLGKLDYIKFLLDQGVELMPSFPDGRTPLMVAIDKNDMALFDLLFPFDKNNKSKDRAGRTAFNRAKELDRIEMVNKFILGGIEN